MESLRCWDWWASLLPAFQQSPSHVKSISFFFFFLLFFFLRPGDTQLFTGIPRKGPTFWSPSEALRLVLAPLNRLSGPRTLQEVLEVWSLNVQLIHKTPWIFGVLCFSIYILSVSKTVGWELGTMPHPMGVLSTVFKCPDQQSAKQDWKQCWKRGRQCYSGNGGAAAARWKCSLDVQTPNT